VTDRKVIPIYLMMLMAHIAHVFEEIWGNFRAIDILGGLGVFLIVNWVLIGFVVLLLYFVLRRRKWAYRISLIYAAIMTLNGLAHGIATIAVGGYAGGFAGCYTGIVLIILGPVMIYHIRKEMPTN